MVHENTLLIVDDVEANRLLARAALEDAFPRILEATNGVDALELLQERRDEITLILLDLLMPRMGGLELLEKLKEQRIDTPVIVCSATDKIPSVVEAMRMGARDFIEKPFSPELLRHRIDAILLESRLIRENTHLREVATSSRFSLVGTSPALMRIMATVNKVARTGSNVLIHGESGTGKEMIARAIHYLGPRSSSPFQIIDCGSFSSTLLESELFGHAKNAFTGAVSRRIGLFQAAGNGTIFLDEIGDLPLEMQTRLLRVLQERQIRPIGSNDYVAFEARLIAATNRDLAAEVRDGRFREDLLHRLNVVCVETPPLRERKEDIPALVEFFLTKHTYPGAPHHFIADESLAEIMEHPWRGNIRELENAIERAINLVDQEEITAADILPPPSSHFGDLQQPHPSSTMSLGTLERSAIERAIQASNGNRRIAAQLVGISEATLYRKLKEFGIH